MTSMGPVSTLRRTCTQSFCFQFRGGHEVFPRVPRLRILSVDNGMYLSSPNHLADPAMPTFQNSDYGRNVEMNRN